VRGDEVTVTLPGQRTHRVTVEHADDGLVLRARVCTRATLSSLEEPELLVWERNRATQLVGFRIDKHDVVVGESWVPDAGLTADELLFYVRHLAAESDRFEALLTGDDVE
jgi:hypothetical protein